MGKEDMVCRPAALKFTIDQILKKDFDAKRQNSQLISESSCSPCEEQKCHETGNLNPLGGMFCALMLM